MGIETEIFERSNVIEECYEYMLAYAAKGVPGEAVSVPGSEIRDCLDRAASAISGLAESCRSALKEGAFEPADKYRGFLAVVDRDAQSSLAAIELVRAQPAMSSQLIDNLNASIHLRALLTDLFLIGEVLRSRLALKTNR